MSQMLGVFIKKQKKISKTRLSDFKKSTENDKQNWKGSGVKHPIAMVTSIAMTTSAKKNPWNKQKTIKEILIK